MQTFEVIAIFTWKWNAGWFSSIIYFITEYAVSMLVHTSDYETAFPQMNLISTDIRNFLFNNKKSETIVDYKFRCIPTHWV